MDALSNFKVSFIQQSLLSLEANHLSLFLIDPTQVSWIK